MPIFTQIAAVIYGALASGLSVAAGSALWAGINFGVRLVASYAISRLFADRSGKSNQQNSGSRVQLPPATDNLIPVVYGTAYINPVIVDAKISQDQKIMWYICALSEVTDTGSITFGDIYWGDKKLTFDSADKTKVVSWTNSDGEIDNRVSDNMWIYLYHNGASAPSNSNTTALTVLSDGNIPTDQRWTGSRYIYTENGQSYSPSMAGLAFAIVKIKYNSDVGLTGLDTLSVEIKNSLSAPGSVLYDYYLNSRYGCGMPAAMIDADALIELDNYSNHRINYTSGSVIQNISLSSPARVTTTLKSKVSTGTGVIFTGVVGTNVNGIQLWVKSVGDREFDLYSDQALTQPFSTIGQSAYVSGGVMTMSTTRYSINGPINTGDNCLNNLQTIAASADSWIQWDETSAKWGVIINRSHLDTTPLQDLFLITNDNIIGGVEVVPLDLNSTYNQIEVQFPNNRLRDQTDYEYRYTPQIQRNLNEPDNRLNLQLPLVNNQIQAIYLANRRLEQSRSDIVVNLMTDYSGIVCNAGDVVRLTHLVYGWTEKLFRVTQVIEQRDDNGNLGTRLTLAEYRETVYDDNYETLVEYITDTTSGITDPNLVSTPSVPVIQNQDDSATIPYFTIRLFLPTTGVYRYAELWISASSSDIENFELFKRLEAPGGIWDTSNTQIDGTNKRYIDITISGLIAASYYFRSKFESTTNRGTSFSVSSPVFNWTPISTGTGSDAYLLTINASSLQFSYNSSGVADPVSQTITLQAIPQNMSGGTLTWTAKKYSQSNVESALTLVQGANNEVQQITLANFDTASRAIVEVQSSFPAAANRAQVTINRVASGVNAYSAMLTKEAMNLPAYGNGLPITYDKQNGMFVVYNGSANITGNTSAVSYSLVNSSNITLTGPLANGYYELSAMTQSADIGSADLRATIIGSSPTIQLDKRLTVTKAPAGQDGLSYGGITIVGPGSIRISSSGQFDPATYTYTAQVQGTQSGSISWQISNAQPTTATGSSVTVTPNNGVGMIEITAQTNAGGVSVSDTKTIYAVYNGSQGVAGTDGRKYAYPKIYTTTTGSTTPARPTNSGTFDWSTGTFTTSPSGGAGWSLSPPSITTSGTYSWSITFPLTELGNVSTTTVNWSTDGTVSNDSISGGGNGSSTSLITRNTSDQSPPQDSEIQAVLGRQRVLGDLIVVNYTGGSKAWQYTATGWVQKVEYIDGSLIVDDSITAEKLTVTTLSAVSATTGSLFVRANGTTPGQIQTDNYAAGSTGFAIWSNGSAEFNNISVRGLITNSSGTNLLNTNTVGTSQIITNSISEMAVSSLSGSIAIPLANYDSFPSSSLGVPHFTRTFIISGGLPAIFVSKSITTANSLSKFLISFSAYLYSGYHQGNLIEIWRGSTISGTTTWSRSYFMGSPSNLADTNILSPSGQLQGEGTISASFIEQNLQVGDYFWYLVFGNMGNSGASSSNDCYQIHTAYPVMTLLELKR